MKDKLTASEAVFGFAAWLTTRTEPVTFGSSFECSNICNLVKIFIDENKLESPRDRWEDNLIHPD